MASLNKVFLIGNLCREFDLRGTSSGAQVGEMNVAVNRRTKSGDEVCYVTVVVWGKAAENCRRYLRKGSCVHVEGYLKLDTWEDRQTGQSRSKLRVIAETVQFISNTNGSATRATEPNPSNSAANAAPPPPVSPDNPAVPPTLPPAPPVDDDIPF